VSMTIKRVHRLVTRATTLVAAAAYGAALIVGMQGPGGVQALGGFPAQQPTLDLFAHPECDRPDSWDPKQIPTHVMIHDGRTGEVRKMDYTQAYLDNVDDNPANNRILLGFCGPA
jgi:hypothetical protein